MPAACLAIFRVSGAWLHTRAVQASGRLVIAIDGKSVRGAKYKEGKAPHLVAALSLVRTGNAPRVMATLRSLAISPLRLHGPPALPPPTATTPATRDGR